MQITAKLHEAKLKEAFKVLEELGAIPEQIRELKRDQLGQEQDVENLTKLIKRFEGKLSGSNKKQLTKSEKNNIEELTQDVIELKDKYSEIKLMIETIDEDAIFKRIKRELAEDKQSETSKIHQSMKSLEEEIKEQQATKDKLSKMYIELKKKIDNETMRIQDLKCNKELENSKWTSVSANLEKVGKDIEELFRMLNNQEKNVVNLECEVFDYSFKEFASSFEERIENRLLPFKKELQEMLKTINKIPVPNDNTPERVIELVKKMVDNKLENFTDTLDQKLIHIANTKSLCPQVPTKNINGKDILYEYKGNYIEPEKLQASIDGRITLKKCSYGKNCDRVFCKRDHGEDQCPQGSECNDLKCRLRHMTDKAIKKVSYTKQSAKPIEAKKPLRPEICMFKNKCSNAKCLFRHDREPCGGFQNCKKVECKRRHHPSRPEPKPNTNRGLKNPIGNTYQSTQQSNYVLPTGFPIQTPPQSQYTFPFSSFPWYGYTSTFQPFPNQHSWPGVQPRRF